MTKELKWLLEQQSTCNAPGVSNRWTGVWNGTMEWKMEWKMEWNNKHTQL